MNQIWSNISCLSERGVINESSGNMEHISHKGKPRQYQKYLGGDIQSLFLQIQYPAPALSLSVRNVPKGSSDIQVSFQSFTENKGLPCRGWFLRPAAGYSWAAAGGKPRGEEEEMDYWKPLANLPTCWPAEWETPAQHCIAHSNSAFSNAPAYTFYPILL